jgi:hypothetical protein
MLIENLISILETKKEAARAIMLASYQEGNLENYTKYENEIKEIEEAVSKLKG